MMGASAQNLHTPIQVRIGMPLTGGRLVRAARDRN